MHNLPSLRERGDPCVLLVHPEDAASLGIRDGERVKVASRVGEIVVPASVDDQVRPGVVSLPHGWGHGRLGTRIGVASLQPGANSNRLTDDLEVDPVSGAAVLNGIPVSVAPLAGGAGARADHTSAA